MKTNLKIIIVGIVILDALAWSSIVFDDFGKRLELYFFAVGQGDSEMVVMPGGVKLLIDGGPPNGKAAQQLGAVLPWHDRYIDIIMLSHAELDHFGGLLDVLKHYEVGAFIYNGTGSNSESFKELASLVKEKNIPVVSLSEGDGIRYMDSKIDILSAHGKNKNEGALVAKLTSEGISALFTGDIGKDTELQLVGSKNVKADILKIPHHGSRFSTTAEFLRVVSPAIAVIEVGKNSYGHPTAEVLDRIKQAKARLFRTDTDGMVQLIIENGTIKQYKEK